MKRIYQIAFCLLLMACSTNKSVKEIPPAINEDNIVDDHNSQNSLVWQGTYRGVLPCADCEGIKIEIKLNSDYSFSKTSQYLGKDDSLIVENGTFSWNESGSNILINENLDQQYKVGENVLIKLDKQGKTIDGELAPSYQLQKVDGTIFNKRWFLLALKGKTVNKNTKAFLLLNPNEKRAVGSGGCNRFSGSFTHSASDSLAFGVLASTKMACRNDSIERVFFKLLEDTETYTHKGDTLMLETSSELSGTFLNKFFE